MFRHEVFDAWAPPEAQWSRWAKPVLFAHLGLALAVNEPDVEREWLNPLSGVARQLPTADGKTAIVVDLPDSQSVAFGLALAELGYRPVPLFNSLPEVSHPGSASGNRVVLDMSGVMRLLQAGASWLRERHLPPGAPLHFCWTRAAECW
jgi:hypothetical protein